MAPWAGAGGIHWRIQAQATGVHRQRQEAGDPDQYAGKNKMPCAPASESCLLTWLKEDDSGNGSRSHRLAGEIGNGGTATKEAANWPDLLTLRLCRAEQPGSRTLIVSFAMTAHLSSDYWCVDAYSVIL